MIDALYWIYRIIVAVLAVIVIWDVIREKRTDVAVCLGIVCIPLLLRALGIK